MTVETAIEIFDTKRILQVDQIVEKHLEAMMNEIWKTLPEEKRTIMLGSSLHGVLLRRKEQIVNELLHIE